MAQKWYSVRIEGMDTIREQIQETAKRSNVSVRVVTGGDIVSLINDYCRPNQHLGVERRDSGMAVKPLRFAVVADESSAPCGTFSKQRPSRSKACETIQPG
jgi:hypothetical protein